MACKSAPVVACTATEIAGPSHCRDPITNGVPPTSYPELFFCDPITYTKD